MKDNTKTNPEGGTDFEGLQDFIVNVNTEGEITPSKEEEKEVEKEEPQGKDGEDFKINTEEKEKSDKEPKKDDKEEPKKDDKVDTPEEKEKTPKNNQTDSYYRNMASKYLEKGKWQDAEVQIGEDGETVKLSELEDIDEEMFFAIEENQSKFREEDIKNNYINKEHFDENKLKVIEILKEGGDIKDIFETPEEAQRPFEGVDVDDEKVQQTVLYNYITQVQGVNSEDAKVLVNNHIKRGELDTKVHEIVGAYQEQYDKKLSTKLEEVKKEKEERKKKDKEFNKSIEEIYKSYNLDNKSAKKLATLGTKRTDDGDFELDSLYSEKMEKPEEAAELIYFLTDKEGYLKDKMAETKIKTQNKHLKTIKFINDKKQKSSSSSNENHDDAKNEFIVNVDDYEKNK